MIVLMDPRRMCPHCRAFITVKDRVCPYCNEAVAPRQAARDDSSSMVGGFIPHFRFNTTIILLLNFGLYIACTIFSMRAGNPDAFMNIDIRTLVAFGAKWNVALAQGEYWRLVTAGVLPRGNLHILMKFLGRFFLCAPGEKGYGNTHTFVGFFVAPGFGVFFI